MVSCQEGDVAEVENYIRNMPSRINDTDHEGYLFVYIFIEYS